LSSSFHIFKVASTCAPKDRGWEGDLMKTQDAQTKSDITMQNAGELTHFLHKSIPVVIRE